MKVIYWNSSHKNFGDDLNKTYWTRIFGHGFSSNDENDALLGIGSILHFDVSNYKKVFVLGSGFMRPARIKFDQCKYYFCFVRGPLTAQLVSSEAPTSITDPAVLIRELYQVPSQNPVRRKPILVPHYVTALKGGWEQAASLADCSYLDPRSSLEKICTDISGASVALVESLHGAIIADIYRVPWVPVATSQVQRQNFKWRDWCASLNLEYKPAHLPDLRSKKDGFLFNYPDEFKRRLATFNIGPSRWLAKAGRPSQEKDIVTASLLLRKLIGEYPIVLSDQYLLNAKKTQMLSIFNQFALRVLGRSISL